MKANRFMWVTTAVLIVFLCIAGVTAAPVAAFSGKPTSGPPSLTVTFKDASTGSPSGWAWFFGDETYKAPWTQVNLSGGWTERGEHSSVAMPDGSIVLTGGVIRYYYLGKNDVWRSVNNGATWTQMTAGAGWAARREHSSVAMPDGSIVLMGGTVDTEWWGPLPSNDVWRSTDKGATWTQMTAGAGWAARYEHSSVVLPDGSIVLTGGDLGTGFSGKNDVWRSTNNGANWTRMNASAGWSERRGHSSVAMPDGSIVLMGGIDNSGLRKNDVWRSTDKGATWTQMNASAGWVARYGHSSVAMPDGSIVMMGGLTTSYRNDVWRSTDNGATWTQLPDAAWTGRYAHSSVAMRDGSIVTMGGYTGSHMNDVWRFVPTGSSLQNPSHLYTAPGRYTVALQVYNSGGYSSMRKAGYITVGVSLLPLPGFSNPPTDPDHDGIYEDLNANGRLDFADVVLYFNQMTWIAANEPVSAFDLNKNGRIDFADIVALFNEI